MAKSLRSDGQRTDYVDFDEEADISGNEELYAYSDYSEDGEMSNTMVKTRVTSRYTILL